MIVLEQSKEAGYMGVVEDFDVGYSIIHLMSRMYLGCESEVC